MFGLPLLPAHSPQTEISKNNRGRLCRLATLAPLTEGPALHLREDVTALNAV